MCVFLVIFQVEPVISHVIFQGDVLVMDGAGVQEYYE